MTEVVEKKFPEILKKVEEFPHECETIKDHAKDEIEGLDFVKKGQAVVAMAQSIKGLLNVPVIFKNIFEMFKKILLEVKDTVMEIKNSISNLIGSAEKCIRKSFKKPVECYKEAYGDVPCTPEEKAEWEKSMIKPPVRAKV